MSLEPATVFLEERSLYSVLGVNPEATKEQIEKAYKVMIRGVDAIYSGTNPTNALHAAEDRKEIEDAYAILSTNNKRQAYDICKGFAHLASPLAPTPIPARVGRPRSNTKVSVSRDKRLAGSELDFAIDGSGLKAFGGGDLKAVDSGTVKPIGEKKENQKPEN